MKDLKGIEVRTTSAGLESYRGYVKERGRKIRGPWGTYADARGWRYRALATHAEGGNLDQRSALVKVAAEDWLTACEAGVIMSRKRVTYAPSTLRGYRQAFKDWIQP